MPLARSAVVATAIASAVSSLFAPASFATTKTFIGGVAFYDNPNAWSPTGVPVGISDDILFNAASTVQFDTIVGNKTIGAIFDSSNFAITMLNTGTGGVQTLTSFGAMSLSGLDTFTIGGPAQTSTSYLRIVASFGANKNLVVTRFSQLEAGSVSIASTRNASVTVSQQGRLTVNGGLGIGSAGFTGELLVNTGGLFTATNAADFGLSNGTGKLTVASGGNVQATTLNLGSSSNAGTGIADISDTGSVVNATTLNLGQATAGSGILRVKNNALASTTNATINPTGSLEVLGGTFTATNLQVAGAVTLNSGVMNVNRFVAAGSGAANFNFVRGTINFVESDTYSNAYGATYSIAPIFGNEPQIISTGQTVNLNGFSILSLSETLVLDGGTLRTRRVLNSSLLELRSGTLEITDFELRTGSGAGDFGTVLNLPSGMNLRSAGSINATVQAGTLLTVHDNASFEGFDLTNAGEITLDGVAARVISRTSINNTGRISGNGRVQAATLNNSGEIYLTDGDLLKFTGTVNNNTAGRIRGRGTFDAVSLANTGRVELSAGFSDFLSPVSNNSGKIIVSGGATASFFGNVTNASGGEIRTSAGARSAFYAPVNGPGSFTGTGVVQFENTYSPGSSPGLIAFGGDVELTDASTLNLELASAGRGTGYDALDIASNVDLKGTLTLTTLGGYVPAYLVPHRVIDAANRTGQFHSIAGVLLSQTRGLAVTYNASGDVFVTAAVPGDTNVDGQVGFEDLLALARNYGSTAATWATGDFGGNAVTEFDDLLLLARNYGLSSSMSDDALVNALHTASVDSAFIADWQLAQSLVPEPLAASLLALSLPLARRRRSH